VGGGKFGEHRQLIPSCLAGSKSATLSAAAVNMQTPAWGPLFPPISPCSPL